MVKQLVFATRNQNKIKEIQKLLPNIHLVGLDDIGCDKDIPETSDTIEGNAIQKCSYVSQNYKVDCFADDTGLMVEALNGAPGVYSARYAGPLAKDHDNVNKLLHELKGVTHRTARFKTVVALSLQEKIHTFEGVCEGRISNERKGEKGFGYDPVFMPQGHRSTFSEMTMEEKNRISHRGKAIESFLFFFNNLTQ